MYLFSSHWHEKWYYEDKLIPVYLHNHQQKSKTPTNDLIEKFIHQEAKKKRIIKKDFRENLQKVQENIIPETEEKKRKRKKTHKFIDERFV